jgi:hypothetical protein
MFVIFFLLLFVTIIFLIIGLISPKTSLFWSKRKNRKFSSLIYGASAIVLIILVSITAPKTATPVSATASNSKVVSNVTSSAVSSKVASKASTPSKASTISINQTLASGYYTVGIDIPAGTYNFTATVGGGNVTTDDGSLNEIMGVASKGSMYTPTYSNADLPNGTVLSVSGVTIQIVSSNASGTPLKPRNQTATKVVQFSDGNYVSGKDFPAGTYNLAAVSGSGNVTDDSADMLNAIMGTGNDAMYEKTYQNVDFPVGTKLTISGVTVSLTPSK